MDQPSRATRFAALHRPGAPFLLPCAWDAASAALFARSGFAAVGTTSLGLAAGRGVRDESRAVHAEMVALVRTIRSTSPEVLVTCDAEDGFSDDPAEVASIVQTLPVDGINLEDSTRGALTDAEQHARKITAVKASRPELFVNARVDTYWVGEPDPTATRDRIVRYAAAGADCIFVPGDLTPETIEEVVRLAGVPVNVLISPRLTPQQLGELGIARISTGSLLYRAALTHAVGRAEELAGRTATASAPLPYETFQDLWAT